MTPCDSGDVVLVHFPFTDLASTKKRPAVVLSTPAFSARYGDTVVLAMTSQKQPDDALRVEGWQAAGLPKPSWLKPLIGTLAVGLIERRVGKLDDRDRQRVVRALQLLIAPKFLA